MWTSAALSCGQRRRIEAHGPTTGQLPSGASRARNQPRIPQRPLQPANPDIAAGEVEWRRRVANSDHRGEGLGGRHEPKALTRGGVHLGGEEAQVRRAPVGDIRVEWQKAPEPAVRVLDRALLPGRLGRAEIGVHPERRLEGGVSRELGSTVEGDAAPSSRLRNIMRNHIIRVCGTCAFCR